MVIYFFSYCNNNNNYTTNLKTMKKLTQKIQKQFDKMCATGNLFKVELLGRDVWNLYLKSFSKEDDPMFRDPDSTIHDCNHCNNFIRRYGNIVAINGDNKIISMFDIETTEEYTNSIQSISKAVRNSKIQDVFIETYSSLNSLPYEVCKKDNSLFRLGTDKNVKRYTKAEAELYGVVKPNELRTFNHFYLDLPTAFVDKTGTSEATIIANHRDNFNVFLRTMEEIPVETYALVSDLIKQGSLLDGDTHLYKVETMLKAKTLYEQVPVDDRGNWCWIKSHNFQLAKFKNELIGVLCTELAEGEELNKACQSWNKRVDPANYMKAVAPITETQKKLAQEFVLENGYEGSFLRRHAVLDDIKANEIKHINSGDGKIEEISIFDKVQTKSTRHKRNQFEGVQEVTIEDFMQDILPTCTSVEALLESKHKNNMVTMTTAYDEDSKHIFKWSNHFSWTYNGNLAGKSLIKEAVEKEGGIINGVLNFRLAWNDSKESNDGSDLDAWATEPDGNRIGYSTSYRKDKGSRSLMSGQLDVDNTGPHDKLAVENITWIYRDFMKDGVYKLWVNQYSARNSKGFKAEIEFNGEVYTYSYDRAVSGNVQVAEVTLKEGIFSIKHLMPLSGGTQQDIYGLETKEFHKVNLVCLSPNHWGENNVGNKHYFFMLNKCKTGVSIRSFHSENLEPELSKHRKVLEVLGAVSMLEPKDAQLSGLGFNATINDEVILKLKGNFNRVVKVKF